MSGRGLAPAALALAIAAAGATASAPAAAQKGEAIYGQICAACHQAEGAGVPGVYPPLAGRLDRFARSPEGRRYLARVVAHGMFGPIRVEDRPYNGLMPPQPQLDDEALAAVLNYVLTELGPERPPADVEPFTAEEVAGHREPAATPSQVRGEREALIEELDERAAAGDVRLARGPVPRIEGVRQDYARWCQGCHRADGMGGPGSVPRLAGFVGRFTRHPEGRDFLARVPGVAFAPLDDARLAALLNWTLATYSPDEVAAGFEPYTAGEVGGLRREPIPDAKRTRARLIDELRAEGVVGDDDGL